MVSVIRKIKKTWPGVPIVYRGLHRPTSPDASTDWTSGQERLGFANFFTDVRVAQIRSMQEHVARQEQLHFFDFGRIWEGYQGQLELFFVRGDQAHLDVLFSSLTVQSAS